MVRSVVQSSQWAAFLLQLLTPFCVPEVLVAAGFVDYNTTLPSRPLPTWARETLNLPLFTLKHSMSGKTCCRSASHGI